tara:strand:+ start:4555 stop:4947 length:393 start_codon:yes stop_codon:yes gene_type:complete
MNWLTPALCLIALLGTLGCSSIQQTSLSGKWTLQKGDEKLADLTFGPGETFQFDAAAFNGVEAQGRTHREGRQITFINERGTDAAASDPAPGTYLYSIDGDILTFGKISDPIQRRATFLSKPWTRATLSP